MAVIHEKRPEVNVSFCPMTWGQNETHIKCTKIFKKYFNGRTKTKLKIHLGST